MLAETKAGPQQQLRQHGGGGKDQGPLAGTKEEGGRGEQTGCSGWQGRQAGGREEGRADRGEWGWVVSGGVVCVGLSCLDLMLLGASGEGEAFGTINTYQQQVRTNTYYNAPARPARRDKDTNGRPSARSLPRWIPMGKDGGQLLMAALARRCCRCSVLAVLLRSRRWPWASWVCRCRC